MPFWIAAGVGGRMRGSVGLLGRDGCLQHSEAEESAVMTRTDSVAHVHLAACVFISR